MTNLFSHLLDFVRAALEIGILWTFYYWVLVFVQGTVAVQVLRGVVVLVLIFLVSGLLHLEVLSWLFGRIITVVAVAFVVIFQPELRRALARIGGETLFRLGPRREEIVEEIMKGILALARRRIGAIVAIERQTSLHSYVESGVAMDAVVSSELLQTLFMSGTPLHDGGVIICQGRLVASACLFPLSENPTLSKTMGTRHRAALGLSEETDAVVIVVSEETGLISLAVNGQFERDLEKEQLEDILYKAVGARSSAAVASPSVTST